MSTHRERDRRGFTIIELVVALGVVLLLAGLTASVGVAVVEKSERSRTDTVLRLLDAATGEWEVTADRKLRWWQVGDPNPGAADVHVDTEEVLIITEILDVVTRAPAARDVVAQIEPRLVHTYQAGQYPPWIDHPRQRSQIDDRFDGAVTVLDAWGKPIYATHPGRLWTEQDGQAQPYPLLRDADGTIRTINEKRYGIAPNRRVVYVSAGPDGYFGFDGEFPHLGGAERSEAVTQARQDNLYSTPVSYPPFCAPPPGGATRRPPCRSRPGGRALCSEKEPAIARGLFDEISFSIALSGTSRSRRLRSSRRPPGS